jgi:hypothetical protein
MEVCMMMRMKVIFRIYSVIYESWSLSTDPPKLVTQSSSIEVDIGSRLKDADNTELTGFRQRKRWKDPAWTGSVYGGSRIFDRPNRANIRSLGPPAYPIEPHPLHTRRISPSQTVEV